MDLYDRVFLESAVTDLQNQIGGFFMKTLIIKIGNSAGTTIPAPLLKSLGLALGDRIEIEVHQDTLIIKKLTKRPHYSLAELLAQCDKTVPMPKEISDWNNVEAAKNETW